MLVKCPSKLIGFHAIRFSWLRQIQMIWSMCCRDPQRRQATRNQFSLIFWDKGAWRTMKNCTPYVHQHMTACVYTSMTPRVFRNTLFISKDQREAGQIVMRNLRVYKNFFHINNKKVWYDPFNIFWKCHCFPCRAQEWYRNADRKSTVRKPSLI